MTADMRKGKSLFATTSNSFSTGEGVTITPNDVVGLPSGSIVLTFDRSVAGKVERIKGTISGSNFVVASGGRGYDNTTEQAHTSPVVEYIYNAADQNDAVDAFTAEHSVAGVHDATKVAMLAGTQTFTGDKTFSGTLSIPDNTNLPTGGNIQVNSADPYRTIVIPAGSMSPTTTAGCASVATVEAGTNDVDYKVLDFDTTTVESAFTLFQMPNNWDGGTITFKPVWTAASGSGTVCFGLKGRAYADDDAIDQAYGTEQTSTDTLITAGDVHIGPESSAITLAGTPAGGQLVQLKITRQTGSDTLGVDARLIGIRILYKIAQYSD